jgi:UDP-N-acetylmuramoyl-L-alanyl-D-glutamate--2,6-diaminopimelate ligase
VPVIGVTGTNGKTTVTTLIQQAVQATGGVAGRIGTTGVEVGATVIPSSLTTPEAPVLHAWFRQMIEADASLIAMEVSSIGLVQRRVVGIPFALGVFTNLTHDHLDFHGTFEAYAAAKALLFQEGLREIGGAPRALLCADDAGWPRMDPPADRWLYGFHPSADVRVEDVALGVDGTSLTLRHPLGAHRITSPLVGRHNAQNLAAAWAAGVLVGVDADQMAAGLAHATGAPGRLERVADPGGRLVLVDYAHTPDALETVLRSVRASLTPPGRLFVVFGCGGDRDRAKRPEMGRVSLAADVVVLTSDNPRSEDPLAILAEVEVGARPCPASVTLRVEPDRGAAIAWALAEASPGDAVLIAGKGHEPYQEIGGVRHPFSDRGCVEAWIAARAALGGDR